MSDNQLLSARRRMLRWRILKTLDASRPVPVGESLLLDVINDCDLAVTRTDLIRALQYLAEKGYCKTQQITKNGPAKYTESALTARGIDYVEYAIDADVGIARPVPL